MTTVDTTAPSQGDTISFEIDLHHRPEKVWRALTDPALLGEWLLPVVEGKLEPGSVFMMQTPPQPGWDGTVHCRMLESEPTRKLSYAWVAGDLDTIVTFTLLPSATGTMLRVVQSGFKPEQKRNFNGARYGWTMMGGKLVDLLARTP